MLALGCAALIVFDYCVPVWALGRVSCSVCLMQMSSEPIGATRPDFSPLFFQSRAGGFTSGWPVKEIQRAS